MKFFRIKQEERDGESVLITGLIQLPYFQELKAGKIQNLPNSSGWRVISNYEQSLPNILCAQLFMVNKLAFNTLKLYTQLDYRCMFLVDQNNSKGFYYIPQLPLIDCLSDKSVSNPSKSHFEKVSIYHSNDYPDIFQISNVRDRIIVISLPLAESLLRRKFSGFYLEKVFIDERPLAEYLSSKENLR